MRVRLFFEKLEKQKNKNMKAKHKKRLLNQFCGTLEKPRLCIFRSNKHIYTQLIDDINGKTLIAINTLQKEHQINVTDTKTCLGAFQIGQILANQALSKNVKRVVFDRQNYKYQGRVKKVIEGARTAGLIC